MVAKSLKELRAKKTEEAERVRRMKEEEEAAEERVRLEMEMAAEQKAYEFALEEKAAEERVRQAEREVVKQELRMRKQKEAEVAEEEAREKRERLENELKKEQELDQNPPASTWGWVILSAVPLIVVLFVCAENEYSFHSAGLQAMGITVSFILCWPMEEANLRRSQYIAAWAQANPGFSPEDLPYQKENLFQLVHLRLKQDMGPFCLVSWQNWRGAMKMFAPLFMSFFAFNSMSYYARLRVFPAVAELMGAMAYVRNLSSCQISVNVLLRNRYRSSLPILACKFLLCSSPQWALHHCGPIT